MARLKSHPVFFSIIILLGLSILAEGWFIYSFSTKAKKTTQQLIRQRAELKNLHEVTPYPNQENELSIADDLKRAEKALAIMQNELQGRGPAAAEMRSAVVPAQPTDLYFDLVAFVEKSRENAAKKGVILKANENFGFSAYAKTGPDRELIPQVFRQKQIIKYLLDGLIETSPREIISVQREVPTQAVPVGGAASVLTTSNQRSSDTDIFEIDHAISSRVPGFVNAIAFRLIFTGETVVLRKFLNKLAGFELPLVVRSVEINPASSTSVADAAPPPPPANTLAALFGVTPSSTPVAVEKPKPIVGRGLSKFTVTVEFIDLAK